MTNNKFYNSILNFNNYLSNILLDLPENYNIVNPFNGKNKDKIEEITKVFYKKYYNDTNKRILVLGSSPARRGTSLTGVPFEDASHLYEITGISIDDFYIKKSNSDFLYEVMDKYGGVEKFYKEFYLSFICPLGIEKLNNKGNYVNRNYYENKKLENSLYNFIIDSIKRQISFGIDTSVVYCIGSGENYKFLTKINEEYKFFDKIIPLEHPRFIMQYNSKDKDKYLNKYLEALTNK